MKILNLYVFLWTDYVVIFYEAVGGKKYKDIKKIYIFDGDFTYPQCPNMKGQDGFKRVCIRRI